MEKQKKKQKGITLIALVISIIVMLILAGVSLNMTVGDNGIISQAQLATIMSRFSNYKEQLELNAVDDQDVYASGLALRNYIPDMEDVDIEKFVIMRRELMYLENDELEKKACEHVGIVTADTGEEGSASAISEVKTVISGVVDLASNTGANFEVPADDFDVTVDTKDSSVGLVGTRLYDRNSLNLINKTWNILIEYNNNNQETARYGSGYYWLKKGETYIINGESKTFENDFIVDYANKQYYVLSGRAVNWNENSTIAVSEGLALNLDPMSFANGEWRQNTTNTNFYDFYVTDSRTGNEQNTGIQKSGDVEYDASTKALKFNKSSTNISGNGGYIKLAKSGLNFSNGLTFEMYFKADRLKYSIGTPRYGNNYDNNNFGLFCRISDLTTGNWEDALRFGWAHEDYICKFKQRNPSNTYEGEKIYSTRHGSVNATNIGYSANQDVYITFTFVRYFDGIQSELYDDKMKSQKIDKVLYYINGELYGYTYYDPVTYSQGLNTWNNDNYPFYVGACPWYNIGDVYYLKGLVYTTRLYTQPMNSTQVKDNYNTTLKYRSSF